MTPTPLDRARTAAQQYTALRQRRDAAIRDAYLSGESPNTIAAATGLSRAGIRKIVAGLEREGDQ